MEEIKQELQKIKKAHDLWGKISEQKKAEVYEAYEPVFDRLETLGVPKAFSTSLLWFGKQFVDSFDVKKK
jgi:serine/threonine-protein kinase RIO1